MTATAKEITHMKQNNETRMALLEQNQKYLQETLSRIDQKLENNFFDIKEELKAIRHEIKEEKKDIKQLLDTFSNRLWTNFYWLLGTMFTLTAGVAGILAKGFKWF